MVEPLALPMGSIVGFISPSGTEPVPPLVVLPRWDDTVVSAPGLGTGEDVSTYVVVLVWRQFLKDPETNVTREGKATIMGIMGNSNVDDATLSAGRRGVVGSSPPVPYSVDNLDVKFLHATACVRHRQQKRKKHTTKLDQFCRANTVRGPKTSERKKLPDNL
uniref:Uncharacterized protein n=1 Tax=Anopheles culicifacies TaxID=139723 RepID=A0A182MNA9_9DIPT